MRTRRGGGRMRCAGQQERVRSRFPGTPAAELALLPSPQRNPDGTRAITRQHLEHRHRQWADSLGELKRGDGSVFDPAQIVLYAYRHSYAQRHADAGVPIDVLAELMDHRNINLTRRYFRVGEQRRREAVDRVTTLTFDRHGNRIWRQAAALSDAEYARYAISRVAVPFGRCSEPSNVQAGGASCAQRRPAHGDEVVAGQPGEAGAFPAPRADRHAGGQACRPADRIRGQSLTRCGDAQRGAGARPDPAPLAVLAQRGQNASAPVARCP